MTLAPLRVREAADSMMKATVHEPVGKPGGPGLWKHKGLQLPAYIQHVANDLRQGGKSESEAVHMAVGIVQNWAEGHDGKGHKVSATTQAAAVKAMADWARVRGQAHAETAAKKGGKLSESELPLLSCESLLRAGARGRLEAMAELLTLPVLAGLLEQDGPMMPAAKWQPTMKRTACASGETARHDIYDGAQHVGTVTERPGYDPGRSPRFESRAINGDRLGDTHRSHADALGAIRRHLEEAPARVSAWRDGKFLVAKPQSYSGQTQLAQYPSESAARYAAGLPEKPSSVERASTVDQLGEMARLDAATLAVVEPDATVLGRVARSRAVPLAEAFNPRELRGLGGKWVRGGGTRVTTFRGIPPLTRTDVHGRARPAGPREVRPSRPGERDHLPKMPKLSEEQLGKAVGKGAWSASAEKALKDLRAGTVEDTERAHRTQLAGGGMGFYSPERTQLHRAIVHALLQGAQHHPGHAEAHFLAGGPATGKSSLIKSGHVKIPKDAVVINPDVVKSMLPEYQALLAAGDKTAAAKAHEESSHIAKLATNLALLRQHHIVVDTVGNSGRGAFAQKLKNAAAAGHAVRVHYATTDVETALKRSQARAAKTGRAVPEGYLRSSHRAVSQRFHEDVQHLSGVALRVYDTTGKPKVIASKTASGKLTVHDRAAHERFLAKRGDGGAK